MENLLRHVFACVSNINAALRGAGQWRAVHNAWASRLREISRVASRRVFSRLGGIAPRGIKKAHYLTINISRRRDNMR